MTEKSPLIIERGLEGLVPLFKEVKLTSLCLNFYNKR
jgi:hypothetical protein